MNMLIIYSLQPGGAPAVRQPEAVSTPQPVRGIHRTTASAGHESAGALQELCGNLYASNRALHDKVSSLKEELNGMYLKYNQMAAAFGEINYFIKEAAAVSARHLGEE